MKDLILKYIAKHAPKTTTVYKASGDKISIKDMRNDTCYFLNINQTKSERSRESFKNAMGYKPKPKTKAKAKTEGK